MIAKNIPRCQIFIKILTFKILLNSLIFSLKNKINDYNNFTYLKYVYIFNIISINSKRGKGLFNIYARNNLFVGENINNVETADSFN